MENVGMRLNYYLIECHNMKYVLKIPITILVIYWVIAVNYYSYTIGFKFLIPILIGAFILSFIMLALILRGIK